MLARIDGLPRRYATHLCLANGSALSEGTKPLSLHSNLIDCVVSYVKFICFAKTGNPVDEQPFDSRL